MTDSTTETAQPVLERFSRINSSFPDTKQIREFKAGGGKVFGWLCTYVPEELIHAARALPVRLTGCEGKVELDDGNAYLYIVSCSFSRSCFQMGLRGKYDCLDGMVAGSTCDGARRLFDHWARYVKTPFSQILSVPHKYSPSTLELYYQEVIALKQNLESFLSVKVSDESLLASIGTYNRARDLLRRMNELRQRPEPPLSGAEAFAVMNASPRMPKELFNTWLEELLAQLEGSPVRHKGRARILVIGSVLNNPEFIKAIEDEGGLVVADELCTGTRYWSDPVVREGDEPPLKAIARRYLDSFPCARIFPSGGRFERLMEIIKNYKIDGVISENIRYCAPYAHDLPPLRERFKEMGVPLLALDIEYGAPGSGQVATRVQAFLEMIEVSRHKVKA